MPKIVLEDRKPYLPDPELNGDTETVVADTPAEPPVEPAKPEPDIAKLQDDARKLRKTIAKNAEVTTLHHAYLVTAEHAKETKKAWEAAAEQLQGMIRGFAETYPLLKDDEPGEPEEADEDDSWRELAVDVLCSHGLSPAIAEKLQDNSFHTIGDLADWTSADNELTAINGIGFVKAGAIEDALEAFWASRKTPAAEPEAAL